MRILGVADWLGDEQAHLRSGWIADESRSDPDTTFPKLFEVVLERLSQLERHAWQLVASWFSRAAALAVMRHGAVRHLVALTDPAASPLRLCDPAEAAELR